MISNVATIATEVAPPYLWGVSPNFVGLHQEIMLAHSCKTNVIRGGVHVHNKGMVLDTVMLISQDCRTN